MDPEQHIHALAFKEFMTEDYTFLWGKETVKLNTVYLLLFIYSALILCYAPYFYQILWNNSFKSHKAINYPHFTHKEIKALKGHFGKYVLKSWNTIVKFSA